MRSKNYYKNTLPLFPPPFYIQFYSQLFFLLSWAYGKGSSKTTPPFHMKVFQEQAVPVWIPCRVTGPAGKCVSVWSPLHGLGVQARSLLQPGVQARVHNFLQGLPTWFKVACSMGFRGRYLLQYGSPWTTAGQWSSESPLFLPQLQGNPCTGTGAPPTPSSLTLLYTGWLFSHFLTPLSCLLHLCQAFCLFVKPYHKGAATIHLGQPWPLVSQSCNRFCPDMEHFLVASHKDILAVHFPPPLLPRWAT